MKDIISVIQPALLYFYVCLIWKLFVVPDITYEIKIFSGLPEWQYAPDKTSKRNISKIFL